MPNKKYVIKNNVPIFVGTTVTYLVFQAFDKHWIKANWSLERLINLSKYIDTKHKQVTEF